MVYERRPPQWKITRSLKLARATDAPNIAAAAVGDAPCCAKSIDGESRAEVPAKGLDKNNAALTMAMARLRRPVIPDYLSASWSRIR